MRPRFDKLWPPGFESPEQSTATFLFTIHVVRQADDGGQPTRGVKSLPQVSDACHHPDTNRCRAQNGWQCRENERRCIC